MVSTDFKTGLKGVTGLISAVANIFALFEGLRICKHVFDPQKRAYRFVRMVLTSFQQVFTLCKHDFRTVNVLPLCYQCATSPKIWRRNVKTVLRTRKSVLRNL